MCYCKNSGGDLQASIEAADLKSHKNDRRAAKDAMAEATAIREKEKAVFDKDHADITANLAATIKATAAIEKGMGSSFLQTTAAEVLRKVVNARESMLESQRQEVLAFLSGQQAGEYAPASGDIDAFGWHLLHHSVQGHL